MRVSSRYWPLRSQWVHASRTIEVGYTQGAEYWFERVAMMQAWADYLDELRAAGKVIPLRRENL
jgi:hypothetical protein